MMLVHLNQPEIAAKIENAWLKTIEDGIHTSDIYNKDSLRKVWTKEFSKEVILRLGQTPTRLRPVSFQSGEAMKKIVLSKPVQTKKELVGVDVFIDWDQNKRDPQKIGKELQKLGSEALCLKMITNRGVKVYPDGYPGTFCTDHWRCRFVPEEENESVTHDEILLLLNNIKDAGYDFVKTEHLYTFDGVKGYSLGQGE